MEKAGKRRDKIVSYSHNFKISQFHTLPFWPLWLHGTCRGTQVHSGPVGQPPKENYCCSPSKEQMRKTPFTRIPFVFFRGTRVFWGKLLIFSFQNLYHLNKLFTSQPVLRVTETLNYLHFPSLVMYLSLVSLKHEMAPSSAGWGAPIIFSEPSLLHTNHSFPRAHSIHLQHHIQVDAVIFNLRASTQHVSKSAFRAVKEGSQQKAWYMGELKNN